MTDIPEQPGDEQAPPGDRRRRWMILGTAAVILVALGALVWLLVDDDDEDTTVTGPETTTTLTTTSTTSTTSTTTTEPETTTTTAVPVDTSTAVFPFAADDMRFDTPEALASAYAERYLGFVDPVYSEFRQGDSRSGEIVVQPVADGPETTLFLRQLDTTWWVLGAAAENITIDEPETGATLSSPVTVRGEVLAFEGAADVELWTDAAEEPLAMTTVTGGGDIARPYEGTLTYDQQPATTGGALIIRTRSAKDGSVWEASVMRVHF